jgi:ribonuclease HII
MWICGVDEAGRGPLAGDVYAAAVVFNQNTLKNIEGLNDSKKISARKRDTLFEQIKSYAEAWSIASASVDEIDEMNILQASFLAMHRAVLGIGLPLKEIWVDGHLAPNFSCHAQVVPLVGGDALMAEISAASILAKVARDRSLFELHQRYPEYAFDKHKGYPTKHHRDLLTQYGPIPGVHRKTFAPVRLALLKSGWSKVSMLQS